MKKIAVLLTLTASIVLAQTNSSERALQILENTQPSASFEAFQQLAKSGDLDAQTLLGEMYLDGIGVAENPEKAFQWLSAPAAGGDSQAQYLLGYMYENGLYVKQDVAKAVSWYEKAAMGGDVMAQYNLALIYKEGKGNVSKNIQEAFKWLKMVETKENKITKMAMK